jgi:hypothetical protein
MARILHMSMHCFIPYFNWLFAVKYSFPLNCGLGSEVQTTILKVDVKPYGHSDTRIPR